MLCTQGDSQNPDTLWLAFLPAGDVPDFPYFEGIPKRVRGKVTGRAQLREEWDFELCNLQSLI